MMLKMLWKPMILLRFKTAHDALSEAAQKLGEAIYKQGQGGGPVHLSNQPRTTSILNEIEEPDFLDENTFDD